MMKKAVTSYVNAPFAQFWNKVHNLLNVVYVGVTVQTIYLFSLLLNAEGDISLL